MKALFCRNLLKFTTFIKYVKLTITNVYFVTHFPFQSCKYLKNIYVYTFSFFVILMSASKLWTDLMLEVTGVYQAWCVIFICKIEFTLLCYVSTAVLLCKKIFFESLRWMN